MFNPRSFPLIVIITLLSACSGGGDDLTFPGGSGGNDGGSGAPVASAGATWLVEANVTQDGCGERISAVHQIFSLSEDGNTLNTSLRSVGTTAQGAGFATEYQAASGECVRTFTVEFADISVNKSQVQLTKKSDCGAAGICENHWSGFATLIE